MSEEKMENVRLNPANDLTILLDKVFKNVFNPTKEKKIRHVIEDKKRGIKTFVTFEALKDNLNQFDKLVFCTAISEQLAGNKFFSIRRLWHRMGGGYNLPADMKKKIATSIEKLACTRVEINMTDVNNKFHYSKKKEVIFRNYLLPCKSVEVIVNGQTLEGAYQILDDSPLFEVAELKKQFAAQPIELLDVTKLHNSELVLKLKFFLLERTTAIIGSHKKRKAHIVGKKKGGGYIYKRAKQLHKIITFEDIFEQCELSDADNGKKRDARNTITKILEHFKAQNFISEWHFEKKNGAFYSIHFA